MNAREGPGPSPAHRVAPQAGGGRVAGPGRDRGFASLWLVLCVSSFCVLFAGALAYGQVVATRHRAGAAADLAALAAADQALLGRDEACAAARRVAVAQGAGLVRCELDGVVADLTVEVRSGPFTPRKRARAGPVAAVR